MAQRIGVEAATLRDALAEIDSRAGELDRAPHFPRENFQSLLLAGVPQLAADRAASTFEREIAIVRALAAVDASSARILDGHFNGVERLALSGTGELRERELLEVERGALLLGVWGADPVGAEGEPARIETTADGSLVLRGVKTFCSGAGGVQRALVVAGDSDGRRRLAYVDATSGLELDRDWYRASGMRASESHRVIFHDAPVLAILGEENELTREPYFSRDAVRTAATWAGMADGVVSAASTAAGSAKADELRLHALGRMRVARATIDRWLSHTARTLNDVEAANECATLALECRVAIADAARTILEQSVRACGARALVDGGPLDRRRRDLDLFLLQHRLDPKLVALGQRMLTEPGR